MRKVLPIENFRLFLWCVLCVLSLPWGRKFSIEHFFLRFYRKCSSFGLVSIFLLIAFPLILWPHTVFIYYGQPERKNHSIVVVVVSLLVPVFLVYPIFFFIVLWCFVFMVHNVHLALPPFQDGIFLRSWFSLWWSDV